MSNENEFVASMNLLENLIDSSQQDINRKYDSLREEVTKLKSSHPALDQITNLVALLAKQGEDYRRNLGDLPNRIREILETGTEDRVTPNSRNQTSTHELVSAEVGHKDTVESVNLGENEIPTEERVDGLDTNVPSTSTVNDCNLNIANLGENEFGTEGNGLDTNVPLTLTADDANVNESTSENEQVNIDTSNLSSVSTTNDAEQSTNETSMQQSNETTLDASKMLWWDSYMEVYIEDEDDYHQIDVPEGGQEGNDNQNESLHEESNGINQSFGNDTQIDQQMDNDDQNESNSTINVDHDESPTSEQSNTRKRRRSGKSLATECSSLENSLPSAEVSTSGSMTMSKRARVSSTLNRRESAEQVNTQSRVDSSDEDDSNGGEIDSSGEGVEQSEDEENWWGSETELGDEDSGHYKIEILKLKCIEDGCKAEVSSRDELHRHFRNEHNISAPYRCLAEGCFERFETTEGHGLAIHVKYTHSNISDWPCPHCTKTYKCQRLLYNHLHLYHFEGQFKCGYDGCHYDRVATIRTEIQIHQNSVHPKKSFTCQFNNCGKSFNHKNNFTKHQRIHTGVKLFRCGWNGCSKSYTLKGNLIVHQRIHLQVKPFKCTWNRCGYASTTGSSVIRHIRMKHFGLPRSLKEQNQLGIEDNRDPRVYFLNTNH